MIDADDCGMNVAKQTDAGAKEVHTPVAIRRIGQHAAQTLDMCAKLGEHVGKDVVRFNAPSSPVPGGASRITRMRLPNVPQGRRR